MKFHHSKTLLQLFLPLALLLSAPSCSNAIFEQEGDCSVSYRLRLSYDRNLKFADAFKSEVKSVRVYAFDESGTLVWEKSEEGAVVAENGGMLTLELDPGRYSIVVWGGLDDVSSEKKETFSISGTTPRESHISSHSCRLERKHDSDGKAYTERDLPTLFHGAAEVLLPEDLDGGEYEYPLSLTKDTKHIRIILQHMSGKDTDVSKFSFSIESANGHLSSGNTLLPDEVISYRAWNTETASAGVETKSSPAATSLNPLAITSVKAAIADLSVNRMFTEEEMTLFVRNEKGEVLVKIPVVDYALLVKGYYNRSMSDQEFLDRQDEYTMTFFLDDSEEWINSFIFINSWRIVLSGETIK